MDSFAEQVFERQFALDIAAVLIVMQTIGRDQGEMDGLPNVASRPKRFPSIDQAFQFRIVQSILPVRVFHLAEVDDAVLAVEEQIDLDTRMSRRRPLLPPGINLHGHARYPQRLLDLAHVFKAQTFKRKPPPGIFRSFGHIRRPAVVGEGAVYRRTEGN